VKSMPKQIRRIYEMPGYPTYGPTRRLWVMLEQLFADSGGVVVVERGIWAYQASIGRHEMRWDNHLEFLLVQGQSEPAAQRTVMQQMLVAAEFVR
jgi:hypothetical protein